MTKRIDRVDTRENLKVRRDPYWQRIEQGRYIGFRRLSKNTPGTWLARVYNPDKPPTEKSISQEPGGYDQCPLGDFAAIPEKERFDLARHAGEQWFQHLDRGGETKSTTVKAAAESYVARLRKERSEDSADNAEGHFRRLVYSDPIANVDLTKLKHQHVAAWRDRVIDRGSRSYFNRNATALRAALNLAKDDRKVSSDLAWAKALRPLKIDDGEGRRNLYLTADDRRKLIDKASKEFKPLVIAWTLLPVRPGEIPKLRVKHLNTRERMLEIPCGKTASRKIPLAPQALAHFEECAKDKLPEAWLVSRSDGSQWNRHAWRDAMRDAVKAAKLPTATCAYSLRHAAITDLVKVLDVLQVSRISGTSIAMIQKHYGHLREEHARNALEKVSVI